MTSFDIIKFVVAEVIAIFDIMLKEIFEIAIAIKVTKVEKIVLRVIKVIVISKAIAKIVTNFLKTRLINLS